jgi:CrcB protein
MRLLLLASAGGAIGAGARHLVNVGCHAAWGGRFPWSTLIVNIVGSLGMGLLVEAIALRFSGSVELRTFLATGILGGFTTFSAFSADVVALASRGDGLAAAVYAAASVALSICAMAAGVVLARTVLS